MTPSWHLARRAARLNPSTIREILKITERPGIVSLAGGLPAAETFPVEAMAEATARVLAEQGRAALQYAASEGHGPLREWVASEMQAQGLACDAGHVLITAGSQQGLDLVAKMLVDRGARFAYLLPNFQNPSGRCLSATRRAALVDAAAAAGLPLVEDNPYGDLWFDTPPPPPLAARAGIGENGGAIYLGSFSKVLAPGLRLGYVIAPRALYPKLLQAKQAADLHTPGFNQRVVYEVVKDGFLREHVPTIRARYKAQRDAMRVALERHLPPGCRWQAPVGGMFYWVELPPALDATALLPRAVEAGVAYVPGAPFFVDGSSHANTLRLSFVTVPAERIEQGVAALGRMLAEALQGAVP